MQLGKTPSLRIHTEARALRLELLLCFGLGTPSVPCCGGLTQVGGGSLSVLSVGFLCFLELCFYNPVYSRSTSRGCEKSPSREGPVRSAEYLNNEKLTTVATTEPTTAATTKPPLANFDVPAASPTYRRRLLVVLF